MSGKYKSSGEGGAVKSWIVYLICAAIVFLTYQWATTKHDAVDSELEMSLSAMLAVNENLYVRNGHT